MGGTLASLKGYVENRSGVVVSAMVMSAHEGALKLPVKPKMLADITRKHGQEINKFWKETFGYGISKLTQGEAVHLRKSMSVDAIRTRIVAARDAGFQKWMSTQLSNEQRHDQTRTHHYAM